jgi:polyisoprenoid-binding protein YceI
MLRRLGLAFAGVLLAAPVYAASFVLLPEASKVQFESKAPMESFTGKTQKLSGAVNLDPASLADSITVSIAVDMASLDTGLALRDRHMRDNHLQVDRFPNGTFVGGSLSGLSAASLTGGGPVTGTIAGRLTLHGVERRITALFEMRLKDGGLHIVAHFPVKLADYAIPRPQMLMMKLGEIQNVTVDVTGRAQ